MRDPDSFVRDHGIPLIALTANATSEDKRQCLQAGMKDFLTKPVITRILLDTREKYLRPNMTE